MMPARTMLLILSAVGFSALGQILLKAGARHLADLDQLGFLAAVFRSVPALSGLMAWTASTICWLFVLQVAPLSRAYLLSSLTYVLVPLAGLFLFGERLRLVHVAGMCLILVGVACLMWGE